MKRYLKNGIIHKKFHLFIEDNIIPPILNLLKTHINRFFKSISDDEYFLLYSELYDFLCKTRMNHSDMIYDYDFVISNVGVKIWFAPVDNNQKVYEAHFKP